MHAADMAVIEREEGAFVPVCHLRDQFTFIGIGHGLIVPNLIYLVTTGSCR
jgi:hypothetical protein